MRLWLQKRSASIAVVLFVGVVGYLLIHLYHTATFPYELTSGEGLLLRDATYLREGLPLYTDANQFPYIVSVYPPGYPLVVALLTHFVGTTLLASRLVAGGAALLTGLCIGAALYKLTRAWLPVLVGSTMYLGSLFVYQWSAFGRVDTLAVLLTVLAITILVWRADTIGVIAAALACVASLYVKQSAIAAPVAILIWLLMTKRRHALYFVLALLGIGGGLFILVDGITAGQFFIQLAHDNAQPYSWRALFGYWKAFALAHPVLLVLVGLGFVIRSRSIHVLPLIFLLTAGAMTWTVGRTGASISYFLEFISAAALFIGVAAASHKGLLLLLGAAEAVWSLGIGPRVYKYDAAFGLDPTADTIQACSPLDGWIRNASDPVLAEDVGIVVTHGKEAIGSVWLMNALRNQGDIDAGYEQLKAMVTQRQFSLILLHWQSYPEDFLYNVLAHYQKVGDVQCIFHWQIYQPAQ